jgi:hypothetical protein
MGIPDSLPGTNDGRPDGRPQSVPADPPCCLSVLIRSDRMWLALVDLQKRAIITGGGGSHYNYVATDGQSQPTTDALKGSNVP